MTVKLKDIAKDCGVGITTVSNVLNHRHVNRYSQETRERVFEVARRYHYRPNRTAQSMRSQRTRVVSFVARNVMDGRLHNYHTNPFLVGLSHYLTAEQYHVSLVELSELEPEPGVDDFEAMPPLLRERFFDGMIISHGLSERGIEAVADLNLPIVRWDADSLDESNCIYRDEYEVGRTITQKLIELGHRRITFAWTEEAWTHYNSNVSIHFSSKLRYEGYRDIMREAGLPELNSTTFDPPSLAEQLKQARPTVLITTSQMLTPSVLYGLLELGWKIPHDICLATCDFEPRVEYLGMQPGGMTYDRYAVGRQAGAMLLQLIDEPETQVPSIKFTGTFELGSCIIPIT